MSGVLAVVGIWWVAAVVGGVLVGVLLRAARVAEDDAGTTPIAVAAQAQGPVEPAPLAARSRDVAA